MVQEVNTIQDVVTFLEDVAREIGDYNPFADFSTYINPATSQRMYTDAEAALRKYLLDRCFEVCGQQNCNFIYLSLVVFEEARDIIAYMQGSNHIS
jgi:hypothetical protein